MNRILLSAAAALVLSAGAAFAENPHVGGADINDIARQQAVDSVKTSSISSDEATLGNLLGSNVKVQESGQGIWGR
ncbi:DUF680 domain-containing protein [Mesorhizobium sp. PUT5]|uniref:DUF680 domain-containing protein n=1 Tax=Mesorhizobium sp. PUT5 TaxID=3454629 RepID=UPI003FA495AB